MAQESARQPVQAGDGQHGSAWYQAATLPERLACWSSTAAAQMLSAPGRKEAANRLLLRWKTQQPFESGPLFAARLSMDNLSEQDLLALLAEPVQALAQRLGGVQAPEWVEQLTRALSTATTLPVLPELAPQFAPLQPLYPLLHTSIADLQAGLAALARQYRPAPFDTQTLPDLLLPELFQQSWQQLSKTLVLELHVARLRGQLSGETSRQRFQHYLHRLCQPEHLRSLLTEYSVLARQILQGARLWAARSLEFARRLCADWQGILARFCPPGDPGQLSAVRGSAGDAHRGGRRVLLLTFDSGWQLVYKPRSLAIDCHFQELLGWLNARGAQPAFRPLLLSARGPYGWSEYVSASSCRSQDEVARFYERQGGYLAIFSLLEATDFHYENVIAAGEHPLFVDLEALFQHRQVSQETTAPGLAQRALENSVLRSLLLPAPAAQRAGEDLDISGLGQVAGQLTPYALPQWEEAGTDEMKLVRKRITLPASQNCPYLHQREVQPLDYLEALVRGYAATYRLLFRDRAEIAEIWLPRFAHDEIRFVARATSMYSTLLAESFHPNLLRHALKRERFLDHLWLAVADRPDLARLIPAERADLWRADIPLFTSSPESRDLWTGQGVCLPDFFARSSLDVVRQRLQALSEEELQRQIWIIRASFAGPASQRVTATPASADTLPRRPLPAVSRKLLLARACAIGDRLAILALREGERADWIGLTRPARTWQIAAAGLDLQSGLPGILLFLGYLGLLSGDARYTELAQAGLNTLRTLLLWHTPPSRVGIGAFSGLGSCLYLFTHLAVLWRDHSLLREARALVPVLAGQIATDEDFNLMDGAAGCIVVLLNLHALVPCAKIAQLAIAYGDHLLAHTRPMAAGLGWQGRGQDVPLSGFSQGVAGIVWSLLRLAAVSGEERFRQAALAALVYERSLFSPQQGNWRDMRRPEPQAVIPGGQDKELAAMRSGMSWSHGAPGIALGRLLSLPYLDDATLRWELDSALATTITRGIGYGHEQVGPNHSLAQGDCGNLETVLVATQRLPAHYQSDLQRLSARVLENMRQQGWLTGVPLNRETPGLLFGLAGIGYQCLRLAEPEQIPSLLTLASPPAVTGSSHTSTQQA
ncbi:MAG TPA: type 2 lanthipeptide synthetase LanM family protein [Ktedonobacteraceae bacterium]|jgi:type 2 lantibiotic biosynthesis protein LanM